MDKNALIKKIRDRAKEDQAKATDPRFVKTMAILIGKGFLRTNKKIKANPRGQVSLEDALWAGHNVEPRIVEVLPALILRFPKTVTINKGQKNTDFLEIVNRIKAGEDVGPDYMGIGYQKMKHWADLKLKDKRTKTLSQRKVSKLFRLSPSSIEKLKQKVIQGEYPDMTSALEAAIDRL